MNSQNTLSIESVSTGCAWKVHTLLYVKRTHTFHFKSEKKNKKTRRIWKTTAVGLTLKVKLFASTNLCIHFGYTVAAINLRMEKIWRIGLARTHRTLPLLSHGILFTAIHKQQERKKQNHSHMLQPDGWCSFYKNTHTRIEFVLVVCGDGWVNGMVWIDLPIKSAATNVLNGFKMSFWCVLLRPYLVDRPEVVCLSLYFLLLLLLRMLHIQQKTI